MLSQKRNQSIANENFSDKLKIYEKSDIVLTKNLYNYYKDKEWNKENVDTRQQYMGKIAKEIWKL